MSPLVKQISHILFLLSLWHTQLYCCVKSVSTMYCFINQTIIEVSQDQSAGLRGPISTAQGPPWSARPGPPAPSAHNCRAELGRGPHLEGARLGLCMWDCTRRVRGGNAHGAEPAIFRVSGGAASGARTVLRGHRGNTWQCPPLFLSPQSKARSALRGSPTRSRTTRLHSVGKALLVGKNVLSYCNFEK